MYVQNALLHFLPLGVDNVMIRSRSSTSDEPFSLGKIVGVGSVSRETQVCPTQSEGKRIQKRKLFEIYTFTHDETKHRKVTSKRIK